MTPSTRITRIYIYPTDTLYGIGGIALDETVVRDIHKIKGSDSTKPMSVIMADLEMIKQWCDIDEQQERILKKYLPGPYTFILRMKGGKGRNIPCGKDGKIGVRIPKDTEIVHICKEINAPIITTSANFHGQEPPKRFEDIPKGILEKADRIIREDRGVSGEPSTVVDLVDKKIIRKGKGGFRF
ncbi:MAG: L-threonylcarbamoyladenylate synthase [Candidatus Micrarchaeota archaeon]